MLGAIYSIMKHLRFDVVYRNIKIFLPPNMRTWVRNVLKNKDTFPPVSAKELQMKFNKICRLLTYKLGAENLGDYLEFGVCQGTSLTCMFYTLNDLKLDKVRLFGFDSFEGLPQVAAFDTENELQPGECASSLIETTDRLSHNGIDWNRTFLIKGWYNETLNDTVIKDCSIQKASLIMIDCNLYSSAKESLNFCRPLIKDTSIIFFGDWREDQNIGEKRAYEEFLQENPSLKSELLDHYKYNGSSNGRIFIVKEVASPHSTVPGQTMEEKN